MAERTFSGAMIGISAAIPATYDQAGYVALAWEEFCVEAIPPLKREVTPVTKKSTCVGVNKDRKGSSKYVPAVFNFDAGDSAAAAAILETAFDSDSANISFYVKFALRSGEVTPEYRYGEVQVGGYAESNGGEEDAIDWKETILWIQRDLIRIAAT